LLQPVEGASIYADALSMVKATQAISEQLERASLVKELLRIAKESAGCDFGRLLLADGPEWQVFDDEAQRVENADVPAAVLRLVQRTRQRLVVPDLRHDPTLADDPALAHAHALVAFLIRRADDVVGILLLENRKVETSFDDARLGVLEAIAAQAAISLENTRLYQEVEQRVALRTRELRDTQKQLVHAAHRAGMAEIASSTLEL
jgi:GAF domain-containing protein